LLTPPTDIELWNAAAGGSRDALGELFRRYYNLLFQYGNKICSDTALLEDTIQELFAELWQKGPNQSVQSVKAYLLQALKFKLYKTFRDQKRIQTVSENDNEPFELSHDHFIITGEEDSEKMKKLLNALNQLPSRQKEVIYLKIYKEMSYEEVSEIMEINYQVVRNLLCQALKNFRKLLLLFV
jgi:RNA polymerase sigma factor (sigma-70 family)